ncbi:hypothetical protein [Chloroherpeton thalassium]|nr:hypothetical protein [Chloroherpeton thalassium]
MMLISGISFFLTTLHLNLDYTFFEAIPTGNHVHLRWETFGNQSIERFEIVRARENQAPEVVAVVQPSENDHAYEYVDAYGDETNATTGLLGFVLGHHSPEQAPHKLSYTLKLYTKSDVLEYTAATISAAPAIDLTWQRFANLFK